MYLSEPKSLSKQLFPCENEIFPEEIWKNIILYLDTATLMTISLASVYFHTLIKDERGIINNRFLICAAERGYLKIFKWAKSNGWDVMKPLAAAAAAYYNHLELLKWLISNGCLLDNRICDSAALGGHLDILIWCVSHGMQLSYHAFERAAENDRDNIIVWGCTSGNLNNINSSMLKTLAKHGHLDIIKNIKSELCRVRQLVNEFYSVINETSAAYGQLDVLKWSIKDGGNSILRLPAKAFSMAAASGNIEILEFLHINECARNEEAVIFAITNGHLDILKWLKDKCLWPHKTSVLAAKLGKSDILEWILENCSE